MIMETKENIELEEMRAQMALLKEKIDKEVIVNDNLMRQAMKHNVRFLNGQAWIGVVAALAVMLVMPEIAQAYCLSGWFLAYTELTMLVCMFFTWFYHRGVSTDMMNGNLIDVAKRMRKMKKDYCNWKYVGYPMMVIWLGWFVTEVLVKMPGNRTMVMSLVTGLIVGTVVGGIIGTKMQKKTISSIDEIVNQIES